MLLSLDFVSMLVQECRGGFMSIWKVLPLWEFCPASNSLESFWGRVESYFLSHGSPKGGIPEQGSGYRHQENPSMGQDLGLGA